MVHSPDESADLTPEERRREIAAILARGVLRLLQTRQVPPESVASESAEEALEPLHKDVEMSEASSVDGTTGSRK